MVLVSLLLGCSAVDQACDLPTPEACWSDGMARLRDPIFDPREAAREFDQACRDGYQRACSDLASMLQDGRGVPRDTERAVALDEAACQAGLGVACSNLGIMYRDGTGGVEMDHDKAERAFEQALTAYRASCTGPTPTYCSNLGWMLESGLGTRPDPDEALAVWKRGCDGGDGESCVNRTVRQLDADGDSPQAVATLRQNCENDVPSACGALARKLGPTEIDAAVRSARHGCGQGDAQACDVLGLLLSAVGPRDDEAAARADEAAAFDRACWLGLSDGCTAVFKLLLGAGATTTAERDAALEHLSLACRIGDPQACSTLATLYRTGELGVVDLDRARSYNEEGCRMFVPDACVALLRDHVELPLIPAVRDKFLADACSHGIREACPPTSPAP